MAAPQKDGYKFITRPYPKLLDDIEITGTLLPDRPPLIREIDGVATEVQPLRGEDIAWLLEVDEVLFFINPYYDDIDPIIKWFRLCGGTLQKFWKLDRSRIEELTYYYASVYDFSASGRGLTYLIGRIEMSEKYGMSGFSSLYPLRKALPDSMIDIPDGFFTSDWFSENYLLRPSDVNMVFRNENPYDFTKAKILSAPLSETIKNYSQIPRRIISCIDAGSFNIDMCYRKNIYHVYRSGDLDVDTNIEEIGESINWYKRCSFDGTRNSIEEVYDQQSLKVYIGELQDVKIVYLFRYRCRQYGEVTTSPGPVTDIYKDIDIDRKYNFTTIDIGSEFIHKDQYGIRYIEIPIITLCTRLKEKILNLMEYTSFVERECPPDAHAEYRDDVEIGSREAWRLFLVGNLPSNLPPLAH